MVKGFEQLTQHLTEKEINVIVPEICTYLQKCIGKQKAVKNWEIQLDFAKHELTDVRVRYLINHIRINNLVSCLVATKNGYYIATSEQELIEYEESLLNRENAIREVRMSISMQRSAIFHKSTQQTLFAT